MAKNERVWGSPRAPWMSESQGAGRLPREGSAYQGSYSPSVSMVVKSSMQSLRAMAVFFFFCGCSTLTCFSKACAGHKAECCRGRGR